MSNKIWERTGSNEMSYPLFMMLVTMWTGSAIAVTTVLSFAFTGLVLTWPIFIGLVVVAIAGVFVTSSDNPIFSFIGLMMIAVPFGILTGPIVAQVAAVDVAKVFLMTTVIVVVLGVIGTVIPENLDSWLPWIIGLLIVAIIGQFLIVPVAGLFGFAVSSGLAIWDWVVIALFFGITVYDFNRAKRVPRTLDNSIYTGVAIYLDWLNIYIRLLSRNTRK